MQVNTTFSAVALRRFVSSLIIPLAISLAATACGTDEDTSDDADPIHGLFISIAGEWADKWDTDHSIDNDEWVQDSSLYTSVAHLAAFNNEEMWAVGQNDSNDSYNANKWSRFDWAYVGADLFYCQTVFDAETQEVAEAATRAESTNPEASGCGTFAWTKLEIPFALRGYWSDLWSTYNIKQATWTQTMDGSGESLYYITEFDNDEEWMVALNASENMYNPDQWSRFDWTVDGDVVYYCQTVFGVDTKEEALSATPADPGDPLTTGCGGNFPWSQLNPDS